MADHPFQLGAGDLEHIHRVIIGQALHKVCVVDHRAEGVAADGPGPHEHQVDAEAVPQNVGDEVSQRRFLIALGMGQLTGKTGDDAVILLRGGAPVALNEVLHLLVPETVSVVDGDHLPGKGVDGVEVGVHHDVEPADLVGAGEAGKGIPSQDVAGGVGHQGDGVHPMLGGDGGAVVEGGPFVQVEQDGIPAVGALPAGGRPGRAGAVGLDVSQAVIELVVDDPGIVAAGNAVVRHQGVPGIGDAVVEVDPFGLSAGLGPCVGLALLLGLVPTGNQP